MNYHICEGQVTEENSRLLFYPDAEMAVHIKCKSGLIK